jgi:Ser/Thr protein kinase RdoA (MazF antagonist)
MFAVSQLCGGPPVGSPVVDPLESSVLHDSSIPLHEADVVLVASREYGLDGTVERLGGERDDNFLLTARNGSRFLLKVAHPRENVEVTNLQSSVLLFLEMYAPHIRVQRVVRSGRGDADVVVDEGPLHGRVVRVTTFLEGTLMRSAPASPELRRDVGVCAALIGQALSSFDHPATRRHLLWDIQRAADVGPLVDELAASPERTALRAVLDRFLSDVAPRVAELRSQVIHNDLSTDNLLVTDDSLRVSGVLDFGDIVRAPAINELAIAVSYQLLSETDLVESAIDVVRGHHSVTPLDETELAVLPGLITARVVTWVTIPAWRSARIPGNDAYVLRNAERSRALFNALLEIPDEYFGERLRRACLEEA